MGAEKNQSLINIRGMESPRPAKRRRTSSSAQAPPAQRTVAAPTAPATPPASDVDLSSLDDTEKLLNRATHVLATEAAALDHVSRLYQTDSKARQSLVQAVDAITAAQAGGGKLITCGVGKSAYIAMKLVATCKSLGIGASFMHACEAVHGDLGDVRANDVLLFVSFSGKTPELLGLLPHLPHSTRLMALSSHANMAECKVLDGRFDSILLSAPIPEKEEVSFGVSAPTSSTTVALAIADMLALTVAEKLHDNRTRDVFKRNHPGGAIGMTHREVERLAEDGVDFTVMELPSPCMTSEEPSGDDSG
ncbi:Hypothetical protein R9X50_00130200 [Acrodontium crateriforme]|uniref:SIS domain-containing protein n=1 Tax=Acrodontium crateriforme TaxID=150365 RepID=A0AAQ3LYU2_9PEZI|nr:Hypothetical protein R9X50_00130200 [Acrodontium crateriforme]